MRVRFERRMASPTHSARPGDVLDLPEQEAAQRVQAGQCVYVDTEQRPESHPADDGQGERQPQTPAALESMTAAQLKEYAAEKGIDLTGAGKKAELLERITTELARREAEDED